jgi:hypothetical protein
MFRTGSHLARCIPDGEEKMAAMHQRLAPFIVPTFGVALIVAWTAVSAPAAAPSAAPHDQQAAPRCFRAANVNGFTSRGDEAVDVHVGANHSYRLSLAGPCPDVDWSLGVALRTTGGSSWICQGADAEIIVPSPTGRQRCMVTAVRPLSPDEVAANRHHR